MTIAITINSVDYAGSVRVPDGAHRSVSFTESAEKGVVGSGGFQLDDPTASATIPALKACVVTESDCTGATRILSGYVADRSAARGPGLLTGGAREWDVNVVDSNTRLSDTVIQSGKRPAETDQARLSWLCGLMGYADHGAIQSGTKNLEAEDFSGRFPIDVLDGMSNVSGRNFWLYVDDASGDLSVGYLDPLGTTYSNATIHLTTRQLDIPRYDDHDYWFVRRTARYRYDPSRVYCGLWLEWKYGKVYKHSSITHAAYRHRDVVVSAPQITTAKDADAQATAYLQRVSTEEQRAFSVVAEAVPSTKVNLLRVGERVACHFDQVAQYTIKYMRVMRRTVTSRIDGLYDIEFELAIPILTGFFPGAGIGGSTEPAPDPLYGFSSAPTDTTNVLLTENVSKCGSWMKTNVPYTSTPCGAGLGGWVETTNQIYGCWRVGGLTDTLSNPYSTKAIGAKLTFTYEQITPIEGPTPNAAGYGHYTQCLYNGDGGQATWGPYTLYGGYFTTGTPADIQALGEGIVLCTFGGQLTETLTVTIPRSCLSFNGTTFVFWVRPGWTADGTFRCDGKPDNSGGVVMTINAFEPILLRTSSTDPVSVGWVEAAGSGTQDGSNTTFTLIGGYTQVESVTRNGIPMPPGAWTATDGTTVTTVGWAPLATDLVIWRYWTPGA